MSTDKELLELAAKAAGIEAQGYVSGWGLPLPKGNSDYMRRYWNPLIDDGDALRLAVKLGIGIHFDDANTVQVVGFKNARGFAVMEREQDDEYRATRRAIVRAAAEIAKRED